jgi:hypothetical protein
VANLRAFSLYWSSFARLAGEEMTATSMSLPSVLLPTVNIFMRSVLAASAWKYLMASS